SLVLIHVSHLSCRSLSCLFFFLILRQPPISTLFPYTTLFRSWTRSPRWTSTSRSSAAFSTTARCTSWGLAADRPWIGPTAIAASDRKSTRLNSSHQIISYAVFCLKKKKKKKKKQQDIHKKNSE